MKYLDQFGVMWEKICEEHVWSNTLGLGVFDGGKGLNPVDA